MLFDSFSFFIFFPVVTVAYFMLPHRFRWLFLLIASCYFYLSFIPAYILILFALIGIDYTMAILIEREKGRRRKLFLLISIISTASVLFVFKYFNFFNINVAALAHLLHWNYSMGLLSLALPLGLSFHTFQSLSYVIEVYRGKQKAERHLGIYALYVMFYPQLVAGPIERPQQLLPQLRVRQFVDEARIAGGLKLMLWGLFKKMVIADRLAAFVNPVFAHPSAFNGLTLIAAIVFFAYQIYCDFSGYSDIAIGSARVMGFTLVQNFNRPYSAQSISDFWRRWHISLMQWFRDYIYIPLGGSRVASWRIYLNIFAVFLISGLWHGASWTFVAWGALHGLYMIMERASRNIRARFFAFTGLHAWPRILGAMGTVVTFILVCIGWIFFRASSLTDAWYMFTHLFAGMRNGISLSFLKTSLTATGLSMGAVMLAVALIIFMESVQWFARHEGLPERLKVQSWFIRWPLYWLLLYMLIALSEGFNAPFIYFQF